MTQVFCRTSRRRLSVTIILGLALIVDACSLVSNEPQPEAPEAAPEVSAQIAELTESLSRRDHSLESVRTAAVMEYSGGGQHVKAREQIAVRRPSSMRVEAESPFGVALVLA